MHGPRLHILHLSCLLISSSSKRRFVAIVWWNETTSTIFEITVNSQKTERTLYLSYDASIWLWPYVAICSCSGNGRAWHWCMKLRIYSPVSPEFPYFHFSIPLVNRAEYLKSVAKMWILRTAEKLKVFSGSRCFATLETAEMVQEGMIL
jgi:hypothetical protein